MLPAQFGDVRFSLPTAGRPQLIATKWQTIVKTKFIYGLSFLAQLTFDNSSAGRTRIDLNFLAVEGGRLHRELAQLNGLDARQSCILPGCPADAGFSAVVAIEILKPNLVVSRVKPAIRQCQSAVWQMHELRFRVDRAAIPFAGRT